MRDITGRGDARKKSDASLPESDVRAMVCLLGEVAASRLDLAGKKRLLMGKLCSLVGAEAWAWTLGCQLEPGKQPTYVAFTHGGFDEDRFARYLKALEHPDLARLTAPIIAALHRRKGHVTRLRQQIIPDEDFFSSPSYPLWNDANVGPLMISLRPIDEISVSGIGLYRGKDSPLFSPRESRIAHIVLSEVHWLHEQGWPEDRGATVPDLAPRSRLILNLLLDGRSRGEIAEHLSISRNTVTGYMKEIYRYFRVRSHAELLSRFR